MNDLQKKINSILSDINETGWNVYLKEVVNKKDSGGCDGEYFEIGSFLYYPYNNAIRPHDIGWTIDDLAKININLRSLLEDIRQQKLMIKYQEIFDIEKG